MKPNIYPGMSRAEYDKIDAINISTLVKGLKSMAHLKYALEHPEPPTDALRIGTAVHIAVFEPHRCMDAFFVAPARGRRSAEDKAWWTAFEAKAAAANGIVLSTEEANMVYAIRDSLRANEDTRSILDAQGVGEMAVVWKDEETGLLCKGMVDRFCQWNGWPLLPDLKTCIDGSVEEWPRVVYKHAYHIKAAWYLDGLNAIQPCERRFIWIAVEKEAPYLPNLHEPDDEMLRVGRAKYRQLLNQYAEAKKSGVWPGYPKGINPTSLPKWVRNQESVA